MGILAYGAEGEIVPVDVILDVTNADTNHRGHQGYAPTSYGVIDVGMQSELWGQGKVIIPTIPYIANSTTGINQFFSVIDNNGNILVSVYSARVGNPGYHNMYVKGVTGDGLGLTNLLSYGLPPVNIEQTFDIQAKLTGSTLYWALHVNGSKIVDKTVVGVTPAWVGPARLTWGGYGPSMQDVLWRGITVSNEPTLGIGVSTLAATAAGFHTAALGSYTDVGEVGVDLTTTMVFAAIGDKESWTITPLAGKVFDSTAIQGLMFSFLVSLNNPAINGLRPFVRSGGIDYPGSVTIIPSAIAKNMTHLMALNPVTGVQFTPAEITAGIEVGLEAV